MCRYLQETASAKSRRLGESAPGLQAADAGAQPAAEAGLSATQLAALLQQQALLPAWLPQQPVKVHGRVTADQAAGVQPLGWRDQLLAARHARHGWVLLCMLAAAAALDSCSGDCRQSDVGIPASLPQEEQRQALAQLTARPYTMKALRGALRPRPLSAGLSGASQP